MQIKTKDKVLCNHCEAFIGFNDKGSIKLQSNKTSYTKIKPNKVTIKCRSCKGINDFFVGREGEIKSEPNHKERSREVLENFSRKNK